MSLHRFFFSPRSEKRGCEKRCTILKDFYYILNYGIESFYESSIIYLLVFLLIDDDDGKEDTGADIFHDDLK